MKKEDILDILNENEKKYNNIVLKCVDGSTLIIEPKNPNEAFTATLFDEKNNIIIKKNISEEKSEKIINKAYHIYHNKVTMIVHDYFKEKIKDKSLFKHIYQRKILTIIDKKIDELYSDGISEEKVAEKIINFFKTNL